MEIYSPAVGNGGGQVGSAYRIGPAVVLTAAHVVASLPTWPPDEPVPTRPGAAGACLARPLGEPAWVPAVVAWRNEEKDVAALRLSPAVPPLPAGSPQPRWGRVEGLDPVKVTAVGFPRVQVRPDQARDAEQLIGFIAPATTLKAGRYAVTVQSSAPVAGSGGSPWAGMSGAALFAGPFLVGVVVVDPAGFGTDRVVAAPVAPLLTDADLAALLDTGSERVVGVGPQSAEQARATGVDTLGLPPVMVGREAEQRQLRTVAQEVGAGGRSVAIVTVHGMGGAGKTALARSLAVEAASMFPDARIEVDLYGFTPGRRPRDPGEVLDELLRLTGFSVADIPATTEGRSQLWRSYLSTRRSLLVLDNARDGAQVLPLLPGGGGAGRCLVVVTSRNRLAELEAVAVVEAGVLPAEDAVALLLQASRRDPGQLGGERAELETLAALCGFLPLALRSVGSLLSTLPPGELIEVMRSAQSPLQHLNKAGQAVAAAFAVSYQALPVPLQDTLRACAWHPGPDFDSDSIAAVTGQPRPLVTIQLVELLDSNMLIDLPGQRYGFHDLFLGYAREAASSDSQLTVRDARERLYARLRGRLETAVGLVFTDNRGAARKERPYADFSSRDQARAWLSAAAGELTAVARAALANGWPEAASLAAPLAYWLHADGKSFQPTLLYQDLHAAALQAGNRDGQAAALAGLGLVAYAQGEYPRARDAFRESCALYEQTGDQHGQADVVKGLADVDRVTGNHREAQEGYQHAYELFREAEDRRGQADALTGLGDMAYARGDSLQAHDAYRQAHDLCAEIGYRSGQADALCGLGDVALLDGEPGPAREAYQQAEDIYLDIGNVHGLAYALKGLGGAACAEGDHQRARETYGRARDLYQQIGFRNRYADVLRGLGHVARAQGDTEPAGALYQQAYDISEQIGYHSGEADALRALGDLAESPELRRDYYLRARELYRHTGNAVGEKATELGLRALADTP
jgi:tetratricopeptide (TPR) repeat protein